MQPDQKPNPNVPPPWDDQDVDEAELESFPASDPPAYTLGVEHPPQEKSKDRDRPSIGPGAGSR